MAVPSSIAILPPQIARLISDLDWNEEQLASAKLDYEILLPTLEAQHLTAVMGIINNYQAVVDQLRESFGQMQFQTV